jgi:hypothetical protein
MTTVPNAKEKELIIQNYITGYNSFDIDKMVRDLDPSIKFENISGGQSNMILTGLADFRMQAEQTKNLFSRRTQSVLSFNHNDDCTEVEIDYNAVLAADFPNGLKEGDEINLKGKSIFKFKEKKVIELTDIS